MCWGAGILEVYSQHHPAHGLLGSKSETSKLSVCTKLEAFLCGGRMVFIGTTQLCQGRMKAAVHNA